MNEKSKGSPASSPEATPWPALAGLHRLMFEACTRRARQAGDAGNMEEALQWCSVAAWTAAGEGCFGALSSWELEAELLRVGRAIPNPPVNPTHGSRSRWLHVLTEAYGTLGHTNLCRRWIQYDSGSIHDVILLNQRGKPPANLAEAVEKSGGKCVVLDPNASGMQRAQELRAYAWSHADFVLLHTHPDEVLATVAFGVDGGPPVLLLNHADHAFWVGCAVADLVVDIRSSGHAWTRECRGVERAAIVPIPLATIDDAQNDRERAGEARSSVRTRLGIPADATVFLTVGSAAKYRPVPGFNFVDTACDLMRQCEGAYLIAVGPRDEGVWSEARRATNGRIQALGHQPDSRAFCRAADVYLEGFPAGSLTALLEAGQTGLACVRALRACMPPYSSDGVAFDNVCQPEDPADYSRRAVALARDPKVRAREGAQLREAVESNHCAAGWLRHLDGLKHRIPEGHRVYPGFRPASISDAARDWLLCYLHANRPAQCAATVAARVYIEAWKRTNSRPEVDSELWAKLTSSPPAASMNQGELARLNRDIRVRGTRASLLQLASDAFRSGKFRLGRKMLYRCALKNVSSVADTDWLKLFVKLHLGNAWPLRLRKAG